MTYLVLLEKYIKVFTDDTKSSRILSKDSGGDAKKLQESQNFLVEWSDNGYYVVQNAKLILAQLFV